jgi:hypothetical protein
VRKTGCFKVCAFKFSLCRYVAAVEWDCVVMARDHRRHPRILDFNSPGGVNAMVAAFEGL